MLNGTFQPDGFLERGARQSGFGPQPLELFWEPCQTVQGSTQAGHRRIQSRRQKRAHEKRCFMRRNVPVIDGRVDGRAESFAKCHALCLRLDPGDRRRSGLAPGASISA